MKHQRAFTLIELLVVIAIIALLVSILMPSLQKAKEMAKDVICAANQKTVSAAIFLYAQDYDDMIPYNRSVASGHPQLAWFNRVARFPKSNWFETHAPRSDWRIYYGGYVDLNASSHTEGSFKCPSAYDQIEPKGAKSHWPCQFSANGVISPTFGWNEVQRGEAWTTHISDVQNVVVLIGDCCLWPGGGWYPGRTYKSGSGGIYKGKVSPAMLLSNGPWPYLTHIGATSVDFYGHTGEKSNIAFTDGHVEARRDLIPGDFNKDE